MSKYLLEIGTEELPARFANSVIKQMKTLTEYELRKNSIQFDDLFCSSTPRRIVLLISGLMDTSVDKVELKKGPKAEASFLKGKATSAAKGFAKSLNLSVEDLTIKTTEKGDFVFGEKIEKGQSTKNLISIILPKIIKSIQGQRFMKWGYGSFKFSRPIRWIISLYNSEILSFNIENIDIELLLKKSSRGHRLIKENLEIKNVDEYFELMAKSGVYVERDVRKKRILDMVANKSKDLNLYPDLSDKLLNELTDLVENPNLIVGSFDSKFLSLPAEVLSTVMKNHQRYIPLLKTKKNMSKMKISSEDILSTKFFIISNGLSDSDELIRIGNENVLKARFSDAKFFVDTDKRISCKDRNQKIKNISYLKGLGTLDERVERIVYIANKIYKNLNDSTLNMEELLEASQLSKNDLCSEMVSEFPELQGIMGGKYLKNEGYSDNVSLAVSEHYLPRFNDDDLPSTSYGAITSISDKFETIISLFVSGKRASGSSDPYALRRNLNGVIQVIWQYDFNLKIDKFVSDLINYWDFRLSDLSLDTKKIEFELLEFIKQRIISHLEELNYEKDKINSIACSEYIDNHRIFDIQDLKKRIRVLNEIKSSDYSAEFINIISRFSKLAKNGNLNIETLSSLSQIKTSLFEKESESKVFEFIEQVELLLTSKSWEYDELVTLFKRNLKILEDLFDNDKGVLIMSEDTQVRKNRLNLIGLIRNYSLLIADFTLLIL